MYTLENGQLKISFDEAGNLIELVNKTYGRNYAAGGAVWRLICHQGKNLEMLVSPENSKPRIEVVGDSLFLKYDELMGENGKLNINICITAKLSGDDIHWSIEIENSQPGVTVRECFFPMIPGEYENDSDELLWSQLGGQRLKNIKAEIAQKHTLYVAQDEAGVVLNTMYPGNWTAMNFFMMLGDQGGLYFGSHDESFQQTQHYLRLKKDDTIEPGFVKYPFVEEGQKCTLGGYVVSPFSGSWHVAADKYKKWIDAKTKVYTKPEWLKTFNGWQRIIMQHQYGQKLFGYDETEQMYRDGEVADVDGLFLFGWHDEGHDAGYPVYAFDATQGGEAVFRKGIDKVREIGGKIILYFNGHLIEQGGEYYDRIGKKLAAKNYRGLEYTEQYRFSGPGTIHKQFGNRIFVGACPACEEWKEYLKSLCDIAIDLNVDAVFFDQIGGWDNVLCWDKSHGHPVPFTTIGQAKVQLLHELVEYVHDKKKGMAFGTEILCDITARQVDFVHNLWGACSVFNTDWEAKGEKPEGTGFIDLFRYVAPDVILSDRDIRDDTDIPRRVNHALLKGLISDVEIFRCRSTIATTPDYQKYLGLANEFREKYSRFLLAGTYCDTLGFSIDNEEISARSFKSDDEIAVVLTQSHLDSADTNLAVDGYQYKSHDGIGNFSIQPVGDEIKIQLGRHALAICIFTREA